MLTYANLGHYGRFGNQLFQIAGTIGTAVKLGYEYGFPVWRNYDHGQEKFGNTKDIDLFKYFTHQLPEVEERDYGHYMVPWGWHHVNVNDWTALDGHMQCEKYFMHCRDKILHYFHMKPLTDYQVADNSISIHVRLGDYDGDYHPRLGMEYYGKALEQFSSYDKIYVFSDDVPAAKAMFGSLCEYPDSSHYMTDWYIMRQCRHYIIGNSTFSWWAAWLGTAPDKKVVIPANWFGPACRVRADDLYCDGWIKV